MERELKGRKQKVRQGNGKDIDGIRKARKEEGGEERNEK